MFRYSAVIDYCEEGMTKRLTGSVKHLRREQGTEVLYMACGQRIEIKSIIRFNGVPLA